MFKQPRGTAPTTDSKASFHQQGREGGPRPGSVRRPFPSGRKEGRILALAKEKRERETEREREREREERRERESERQRASDSAKPA